MSSRFAAFPELRRWLPVPAIALALATPATAQVVLPPPKAAPISPAAPTTRIAIELPTSTRGGLVSRNGMPWDQLRRNGMNLAVDGPGGMEVVVHVIRLDRGRVVNRWSSSSRVMARGGNTSLAGERFLPGTSLRPGTVTPQGGRAPERNVGVTGDIGPANPWIPVGTAMQAISTGDLSPFIQPGMMGRATGIIIVAVPSCSGGDSSCLSARTQAALVMPCLFSDQ